jgi:hypothetical protein
MEDLLSKISWKEATFPEIHLHLQNQSTMSLFTTKQLITSQPIRHQYIRHQYITSLLTTLQFTQSLTIQRSSLHPEVTTTLAMDTTAMLSRSSRVHK